MKIAMITTPGECAAMAGWIAANAPGAAEVERWVIDSVPAVAEQVLDALAAQWAITPAGVLIFPSGSFGDELATRLAWRLRGDSVCQVVTADLQQGRVSKSHWGGALLASLPVSGCPVCLSLARQPDAGASASVLPVMTERRIVPAEPPDWLEHLESVKSENRHPLLQASHVLVVGQGGREVEEDKITALAQALRAEAGYSRARVMNGGVDVERMVGITGHLLSPDVCIVAGASGAAALMAGIRQSQFVVAINCDPDAPVFSQADVGIVDDWPEVLEELEACTKT